MLTPNSSAICLREAPDSAERSSFSRSTPTGSQSNRTEYCERVFGYDCSTGQPTPWCRSARQVEVQDRGRCHEEGQGQAEPASDRPTSRAANRMTVVVAQTG